MTEKLKQAAELALDALEEMSVRNSKQNVAIVFLRIALAEQSGKLQKFEEKAAINSENF